MVLKTIALLFTVAPNSKYKAEDLAAAFVGISTKKASAERCEKPSGDTLLRRLRQVNERSFKQAVEGLNLRFLRMLGFRRWVTLALDFRTLAYYGTEQPQLVPDPRLKGTNLGIRFAMLSVVEAGRTITLRVHQVTPFNSKVGILKRMLHGLPLKPRLLLLDRGFYAVEAILALKSMGLRFLIAAKKTAPIKRLCKRFERGELPAITDYVVRSGKDSVRVKLILTRRRTERGWEIHPFVSTLPFAPELVSELYGRRWRIETNNREVLKFMAMTTSPEMKLRRMYYRMACLLYNAWITARSGESTPRAYGFKSIVLLELRFSRWILIDDHPPPL